MPVDSYLNTFADTLVLTMEENASIEQSIRTLKLRLDKHFGSSIKVHLQIGSSTRGTILPRWADSRSDIDYMVVFNTSEGKYKPQTYLNQLKVFTKKYYPSSEIHQSSPTIVLSLNHISFELVPAIRRILVSGYKIPSQASSWTEWTSTNPGKFGQEVFEKNKNNKNKILPLVRLVKYWNAQMDYPFRSFELEKHIVQTSFWFCSSLQDYFYKFWTNFDQDINKDKGSSEKLSAVIEHVKNAKELERLKLFPYAVMEIKKIFQKL